MTNPATGLRFYTITPGAPKIPDPTLPAPSEAGTSTGFTTDPKGMTITPPDQMPSASRFANTPTPHTAVPPLDDAHVLPGLDACRARAGAGFRPPAEQDNEPSAPFLVSTDLIETVKKMALDLTYAVDARAIATLCCYLEMIFPEANNQPMLEWFYDGLFLSNEKSKTPQRIILKVGLAEPGQENLLRLLIDLNCYKAFAHPKAWQNLEARAQTRPNGMAELAYVKKFFSA